MGLFSFAPELLLTAVFQFAATPSAVAKWSGPGAGTVAIAMMKELPEQMTSREEGEARVVAAVIRTPDDGDLILLSHTATPPQLVHLVENLRASRHEMPVPDRGYIMLEAHGGIGVVEYPGDAAAMAGALRRVRNAPERPLRNLGNARWSEFSASELGL